jgi:hypothetical protein
MPCSAGFFMLFKEKKKKKQKQKQKAKENKY